MKKLILLLVSSLILSGCAYRSHFYKNIDGELVEVGRISANSKGLHKFKDNDMEMSSDFGKPIISLGNIAPKFEGD